MSLIANTAICSAGRARINCVRDYHPREALPPPCDPLHRLTASTSAIQSSDANASAGRCHVTR